MRRVNSVTRGHPISICLIMAAGMMMVILLSVNANAFTCANGNGEEMASGPMLVDVNNVSDSALAEAGGSVNQELTFAKTTMMAKQDLVQNTMTGTTITDDGAAAQTNSHTANVEALTENYGTNEVAMNANFQRQQETTRIPVHLVNNGHTTVLTRNHGSGTPRLMAANSGNTAVSAASRAHVDATRPASSI